MDHILSRSLLAFAVAAALFLAGLLLDPLALLDRLRH